MNIKHQAFHNTMSCGLLFSVCVLGEGAGVSLFCLSQVPICLSFLWTLATRSRTNLDNPDDILISCSLTQLYRQRCLFTKYSRGMEVRCLWEGMPWSTRTMVGLKTKQKDAFSFYILLRLTLKAHYYWGNSFWWFPQRIFESDTRIWEL